MGAAKYHLYTTLGVARDSSTEEVTRAYRRLALQYHPDRNPDGVEEFKAVSNAYAVLADPERRAVYDLTGFVSDAASAAHDVSDASARQQRSAELADQVRDFFATYAGSAEEKADVVKGYEKCHGDFGKMVRQYLLFDNGITTEVQRLYRLVAKLIEKGKLCATPAWEASSTPKSVLKLEKAMRREREEAEEALKELAGGGGGDSASAAGSDLGALQLAIRQRQQSSYESMLNHLESKYVTNATRSKDDGVHGKRRREAASSGQQATRRARKQRRSAE